MIGKHGKNRIKHKGILSVLLAVALLLEPLLGMPAVYAEEIQYEYGKDATDSVSDNDSSESSEDGNRDGEAEDDGGDRKYEAEDEAGDQKDEEEDNTGGREEDSEAVEGREEDGDIIKDDQDGTVSGNEIEEVSDPDGFSDMPADYRLTSFQRELKADMYSTLSAFKEEDEGETFAEDQVITFAESEEEAELIAEAYHAEIVCFDMGVLTMKLGRRNTVKTALLAAADMDNNLPPVWPNYIRELYGEPASATEDMSESETENVSTSELEITEEEYVIDGSYEQALNELTGYNDPYLKFEDSCYQWFHTTIGSTYAWTAGYTGNGVKVGVIDSGVDANADLNANIFGKIDFCDGTEEVSDCIGHGTHVAGIIAAVANNASGGAGVAPQAKIFNARVFGKTASKSGYDSTIIAAINYLIGEENNTTGEEPASDPARVDIINMSLGGPGMNGAFQAILDKAYKKGVIVVAATGNDGGTLQMYPASYDHVISVAATDTNNERAYFSNYGALTDLSAPGVNIWATYVLSNGSADTAPYRSLNGTSVACPVVVGEAAVILSGKDDLPSMKDANGNDKTGGARVDAVESIMKGSTISAGSGMGRGITSLTKVFGLSTAATKPKAPVITVLPDDTKQFVTVTIRVQDGMTVCYTTNGKNPVYKNGAAGADTTMVSGNKEMFLTIDCSKSAKGTIKAIAVNASGVVSPVKSVSYTLRPYISAITVSGPTRVERGKSIQLKAAITPTYATNKSVTWELQPVEGEAVDSTKIKIDQKGKITTAKDADIGIYQVIVRAKDDGGEESKPYSVQVTAENTAIQKIAFGKNVKKELWLDAKTQENTVSLFDYVTAEKKDDMGKKNLPITDEEEREELKKHLVWTSSKPEVAAVDLTTGKVTAKTVGTTAITVQADDNLAKKAIVNITVKQAVTGITIKTDKDIGEAISLKTPIIAAGKSITLKTNIRPVKPANNKVNWSIAPDTAAGNTASAADMKNITINKTTGKITTKANVVPGSYIVTAEAADGKGAIKTRTINVIAGAIGEIKLDQTKATLYATSEGGPTYTTITAAITGMKDKKNGTISEFDPEAYMVTASNPSVAGIVTATSETEGSVTKVRIVLMSAGRMFGKTNIIIFSTDGSNKKATCTVTVKGDIKKVRLQDNAGSKVSKLALFRNGTDAKSPKTAEIYAVIEGSEGANKEAYEVTSSNPSLVSVTTDKTTGKITLTANDKITGKATITLKTTDGSKKKAACTVIVNNPPSRINIAPKAGTAKYVVPGKSVQLKATLETEYGAVAGKSVTWSLPESYKGSGISVNGSGKVSVARSYTATTSVPVTAAAKDGSGASATCYVTVVRPTTYITIAGRIESGGVTRVTFSSDCKSPMSCSSSSPGVISPTISYNQSSGSGTITFVPMKKGTATITIRALDSSGKSCREVYRVR